MAMTKYSKTYVSWGQVPVVLNVSDVCIILRVSDRTVTNLLNSGKLKGKKMDGKWVITKDNLQKYLDGDAA